MNNNVVRMDALKQEFKSSPSVEITEIHAGFSRRFNLMIDLSDIDAPSLNDGRVGFAAELLGASRPAVTDWLTKNKPPKETSLFEVVRCFLKHIDSGEDILPARVVSWLRYGDEVSPCPFGVEYEEEDNQEMMPLAASIIAEEAKELGFGASSYDLEAVLNLVVKTLVDFEIQEKVGIKEVHRKIVQQHIRTHSR
ncbi:hypothetical protein [Teredinibacter purpureus]|uniref:hypothetical protein n=1 Tax=Teredinibacter purpureus TaxID=2731756 RepID=UPI0005F85753|nr:hypothetical protein [Teredinibacter purpureus]